MGFDQILTKTYYNNTILDWSITFLIIAGSVIIGKIAYWFFSSVIKKMTAKTQTKLDDIVIDMIEEPAILSTVLGGVWYAFNRLHFADATHHFLVQSMYAAIIITITWMVARLLNALTEEYLVPLAEKSDTDLDDVLLPVARKITNVIVWALGIIVALNNMGIEIGPLIAGLGIGGLALAMAAKDTVANFFGGFTIFTDKPFTVGDRVRFGGFDGTIFEIGLRSSRLRTLNGTVVTIPNGKIVDSLIENVTLEPSRKVVSTLGLVYDLNAEQMQKAMDLLKEIAKEAGDALEENVIVGFLGFGDSALEITFIYYIKKDANIVETQTAINLNILEKFAANQLDFAYPTQTIYTKQG